MERGEDGADLARHALKTVLLGGVAARDVLAAVAAHVDPDDANMIGIFSAELVEWWVNHTTEDDITWLLETGMSSPTLQNAVLHTINYLQSPSSARVEAALSERGYRA